MQRYVRKTVFPLKMHFMSGKGIPQKISGDLSGLYAGYLIFCRKAPVRRKFAVRQLIGSPGRSFVIFLGIFLGAFIVAFAFSFIDSVKAVGAQAHSEFGSFRYEYILNSLKDGKPEKGEAVFALPYEDNQSRRFTLMGLDNNTKLWNKTLTSGETADTENGFYITTLFEEIFGVHKGDSFTFRSIAALDEKTVRIDGVIKNGYQSYILTSRKKAAEISGLDGEFLTLCFRMKCLIIKAMRSPKSFPTRPTKHRWTI